jgi:hypothetical protein
MATAAVVNNPEFIKVSGYHDNKNIRFHFNQNPCFKRAKKHFN